MEAVRSEGITPGGNGAAMLTVGFGTAVAMWAVGYLGRLPAVLLPSPLILVLVLAVLFAGGLYLGRRVGLGWIGGALVGLIAGALNLLVLGSFLSGSDADRIVPSALWWLPGSILVSAALAGAGAWLGSRSSEQVAEEPNWPGAFARVAVAATFLLLAVGGLVTSAEAGLAVVDWPNSYGYNMFLYPFSRMTGGIYYEHAHRLFGALVGLTTIVLALFLQRVDRRRWVRRLAWLAVVMVVVQGLLGGLRVTGGFTLSTSAEAMRPSLLLAVIHGVFGQLFFATLVALAVFSSTTWRTAARAETRPTAGTDRVLGVVLLVAVLIQLILGATLRHTQQLLMVHMMVGLAVVAPLTINAGIRAWGLNRGQRLLQRLGMALMAGVGVQLILGFIAYAVTNSSEAGAIPSVYDLALTTTHQWFGAFLLALAVALACWNYRLLADAD